MNTDQQPTRLRALADWFAKNADRLPAQAPNIELHSAGGMFLDWHLTKDDDAAREALARLSALYGPGKAGSVANPVLKGEPVNWTRWCGPEDPDVTLFYSDRVAREAELATIAAGGA